MRHATVVGCAWRSCIRFWNEMVYAVGVVLCAGSMTVVVVVVVVVVAEGLESVPGEMCKTWFSG